MTPLAPALQAFFSERLITQRNASPQTIAAYRDTFRLLLAFAHKQTGKQPFQLDIDDLERAADRRIPQPPPRRSTQQPQDAQRQARGDPLLLPVRRAQPPRARRHDRTGNGDPDQAPRAQHRLLSGPRRDQGAARRARHRHLARPPRPRATAAHDPDRRARLRAHHLARRRRPPRHRRPHPDPRQRQKETRHDPHPRNRPDPAPMAHRTPRRPRGPAVLDPSRPAAQPLHRRRAGRKARRHGDDRLPVA